MMHDTKEVRDFYQQCVVDDLCKLFHQVKNDIALDNDDLRLRVKMLGDDIKRWSVLDSAYNAHHPNARD